MLQPGDRPASKKTGQGSNQFTALYYLLTNTGTFGRTIRMYLISNLGPWKAAQDDGEQGGSQRQGFTSTSPVFRYILLCCVQYVNSETRPIDIIIIIFIKQGRHREPG
jgi:hypothetical protein